LVDGRHTDLDLAKECPLASRTDQPSASARHVTDLRIAQGALRGGRLSRRAHDGIAGPLPVLAKVNAARRANAAAP